MRERRLKQRLFRVLVVVTSLFCVAESITSSNDSKRVEDVVIFTYECLIVSYLQILGKKLKSG